MNKSDIKLSVAILLVVLISIVLLLLLSNKKEKQALVYYEDNLVSTIDLSIKKETEYEINGYNGPMKIVAKDGKIKVEEENSPLHLCSKQGWIDSSYEVIICLPNKVVVKIEDKTEIDTVVK